MPDLGRQSVLFPALFSKPIVVTCDEQRLSSDGGSILLLPVDRSMRLTEAVAGAIEDCRQPGKVTNALLSVVRQRVFAIINGYPDGNDAAQLARDPLLLLACDRSPTYDQPLASQPTLSRFENAARPRTLLAMAETLADTVLANCGGMLTFTGIVTNNGTMRAINGSTLEAYGTVVNNGLVDIINGAKNFHGTFINSGTVLDASSVRISSVTRSSNNIIVQIPSVVGHTYQLQVTPSLTPSSWTNTGTSQPGNGLVLTFTDLGGATNSPSRFYRLDCTAP